MIPSRNRLGPRNSLAAVLAFTALLLQLLFPAGFMADTSGAARHGIPIVICTAQGQITADWIGQPASGDDHGKKAPAKPMAPCAFAGHATVSAPPIAPVVAMAVTYAAPAPIFGPVAPSPGRGLAAPPPPAIGPPTASLAA